MKRTHRMVMSALVCALLIQSTAEVETLRKVQVTQDITCVPEFSSGVSGSVATQKCLDKAKSMPKDSTLYVELEAKTYAVTSKMTCENREGAVKLVVRGPSRNRKALMLADPNLGNESLFDNSCSNLKLQNVWFSGNKDKRSYDTLIKGWEDNKDAYHYLCDADGWRPANILLRTGFNIRLEDVDTTDAPCGTGVGVSATNVEFVRVNASFNGFPAARLVRKTSGEVDVMPNWPNRSHQTADGATFEFCANCSISDSVFDNNTDLGLVLGGGPNNTVFNNHCTQNMVYAFACYSIGRFNTGRMNPKTGRSWDGDHEDLEFTWNTGKAELNMASFGAVIGPHVFVSKKDPNFAQAVVHDGGVFYRNSLRGFQVLLVVEGVEKVRVQENDLDDPQGNVLYFNHCLAAEKYVVGHVKPAANLQPFYRKMNMDGGECEQ